MGKVGEGWETDTAASTSPVPDSPLALEGEDYNNVLSIYRTVNT